MSALQNSSLPPPVYLNNARAQADSVADAFAGSDVLMPPRPDDGAIPDWHLATDMKPLRPLPRDLADTVRHRSVRPALGRASRTREKQARRPLADTAKLADVPRSTSQRWALRVVGLLLAAVLVGAAVGSLFERIMRQASGS
jgi:hypothetical protein